MHPSNFGYGSGFDFDLAALAISGVVLILAAAIGFGGTAAARWISLVIGLLFAGYAFYLNFIFDGDRYTMPIYAYIAPFIVVYNIFRSRSERKREAAAAAAAAATPPPPAA
jgi:Zn-dependent protease with chaperone function